MGDGIQPKRTRVKPFLPPSCSTPSPFRFQYQSRPQPDTIWMSSLTQTNEDFFTPSAPPPPVYLRAMHLTLRRFKVYARVWFPMRRINKKQLLKLLISMGFLNSQEGRWRNLWSSHRVAPCPVHGTGECAALAMTRALDQENASVMAATDNPTAAAQRPRCGRALDPTFARLGHRLRHALIYRAKDHGHNRN